MCSPREQHAHHPRLLHPRSPERMLARERVMDRLGNIADERGARVGRRSSSYDDQAPWKEVQRELHITQALAATPFKIFRLFADMRSRLTKAPVRT